MNIMTIHPHILATGNRCGQETDPVADKNTARFLSMIYFLPLRKGQVVPSQLRLRIERIALGWSIDTTLSKIWRLPRIEVKIFDWAPDRNRGNERCWWWVTPGSYSYASSSALPTHSLENVQLTASCTTRTTNTLVHF